MRRCADRSGRCGPPVSVSLLSVPVRDGDFASRGCFCFGGGAPARSSDDAPRTASGKRPPGIIPNQQLA
eukprot:6870333-Prymnesium_polylepis.1